MCLLINSSQRVTLKNVKHTLLAPEKCFFMGILHVVKLTELNRVFRLSGNGKTFSVLLAY